MKIGGAVFQCSMGLKEGLTEKVTFQQGPQGGEGSKMARKNVPDEGDSKGKTQRPSLPGVRKTRQCRKEVHPRPISFTYELFRSQMCLIMHLRH